MRVLLDLLGREGRLVLMVPLEHRATRESRDFPVTLERKAQRVTPELPAQPEPKGCSMTIKGANGDPIYPIVFKPMGENEIESFTAAILVPIDSPESVATVTCNVESGKGALKILNLTIAALEVEVLKP